MIRQAAAPNGSEASPMSPSSKNVAEMPRTVSAPNHVAKTMAKTIKNGRFLPALIKSSAVFVFLEKYSPIKTDNRIYTKIKLSTIIKRDDKANKNENYQ